MCCHPVFIWMFWVFGFIRQRQLERQTGNSGDREGVTSSKYPSWNQTRVTVAGTLAMTHGAHAQLGELPRCPKVIASKMIAPVFIKPDSKVTLGFKTKNNNYRIHLQEQTFLSLIINQTGVGLFWWFIIIFFCLFTVHTRKYQSNWCCFVLISCVSLLSFS